MRAYLSLCYHYVRPDINNPYPKIFGQSESEFREHLEMLRKRYHILTPAEAEKFSTESNYDPAPQKELGMLITFDDGLSDHYRAAQILNEYGFKAVFNIPTCIFQDHLPANPIIIHYGLAIHRIEGFLEAYRNIILQRGLAEHNIPFIKGEDDQWKTIRAIKNKFKYELDYNTQREILIDIWANLLLKNDPGLFQKVHLREVQLKEMVKAGHSLGVHTRTHISVAATQLSGEDFIKEIIEPQEFLERTFNISVPYFSYPFGEKRDCLSTEKLLQKASIYKLAFAAENDAKLNTRETSPYQIWRLIPWGIEKDQPLKEKLDKIN